MIKHASHLTRTSFKAGMGGRGVEVWITRNHYSFLNRNIHASHLLSAVCNFNDH